MKQILFFLCIAVVTASCKKEYSYEAAPVSIGTCPTTNIDGSIFSLSRCTFEITMNSGQGNKTITTTLVESGVQNSYGYFFLASDYTAPNCNFPIESFVMNLQHFTTGSSQLTVTFIDGKIPPGIYSGVILISIHVGVSNELYKLPIYVTLKVR